MNGELKPSEQWLQAEDQGCFDERVARLEWLAHKAPRQQHWLIYGGWLNQQLFEETRYCFVYGQFLSSAILGFAFVERTVAAMFYASGRDDLERANSKKLFQEAQYEGWIKEEELDLFEEARKLRNPLTHFRTPMHEELPESRAFHRESEPHEVVETDARHILEVAFRLVERNAAG
jgi:hypothetical protein